MTCDDRKDELLLDAFGGLESAESQSLHAHLATGCSYCAGSAAEASAIAAQFAQELKPQKPSAEVVARLMNRVSGSANRNGSNAGVQIRQSASIKSKPNSAFRLFPTLATAGIAAALAAVITGGVMWSQLRDERLLRTPDLRYVSLAGSVPQPKASGRIFWDADHGYWHVYVFDLAPPASGKTYELWFIGNDGRKTAAGLFNVNADGAANLVVKVPNDLGPLAAAAVTDEDAGGVAQPAGKIQLVGKIE